MLSRIKQFFRIPSFRKQDDFPLLTHFEILQEELINEFIESVHKLSNLCCSKVVVNSAKLHGTRFYTLTDSFRKSLNLDLFLQRDTSLDTEDEITAHLQLFRLMSKVRKLGTTIANNTTTRYALIERLFQESFYADLYETNYLVVYNEHVYFTIVYTSVPVVLN